MLDYIKIILLVIISYALYEILDVVIEILGALEIIAGIESI